jgi:hypothetical protein
VESLHLTERHSRHAKSPNPTNASPRAPQRLSSEFKQETNKARVEFERSVTKIIHRAKTRGSPGTFLALGNNTTELLAIGQHEIHVLVERQEGSDQLAAVLEGDTDAPVDKLEHLCTTGHRLKTNENNKNT